MNLFSSVMLLLFLFKAQFGEPADEPSKTAISQSHEANTIPIPCPERRSSSGKADRKSTPSLLCKRQEDVHFWQGQPAWHMAQLSTHEPMKRKKHNPLINWNAFGLRYGKRQAVKEKMKP